MRNYKTGKGSFMKFEASYQDLEEGLCSSSERRYISCNFGEGRREKHVKSKMRRIFSDFQVSFSLSPSLSSPTFLPVVLVHFIYFRNTFGQRNINHLKTLIIHSIVIARLIFFLNLRRAISRHLYPKSLVLVSAQLPSNFYCSQANPNNILVSVSPSPIILPVT